MTTIGCEFHGSPPSQLLRGQAAGAARTEPFVLVQHCARACVQGGLSPTFLQVLPVLFDGQGAPFDFDQLGHFLRELGLIWWEARRNPGTTSLTLYAAYAPHFGNTLHAAIREFLAAAARRTYKPERVAKYAWSALHESWSPWVTPHCSAPLLACTDGGDAYAHMLARFVGAVDMVTQNCPGCEDVLLQNIFEWAVRAYLGLEPHCPQESKAQVSALLTRLATLPWQRQWFGVDVLPLLVQISRSTEQELTSWCSSRLWHQSAETWIRDAPDERLAPTLAALLEVFLSKNLVFPDQTLDEACRLPWGRMPTPAVDAALERYFSEHFNPATPYHHAPQFTVLLSACLLVAPAPAAGDPAAAVAKRALAVSWWARAASAPVLLSHVPEHCRCMLDTLTELAPRLEASPSELENLLSRAAVLLCVDPAASSALPVWREWATRCPLRMRRALIAAATAVTTPRAFAILAEAVTRAMLRGADSSGWSELYSRWATYPYAETGALLARGCLYAAYASLLARTPAPAGLRHALGVLRTADIDLARYSLYEIPLRRIDPSMSTVFVHLCINVDNEAIVALWICAAGRLTLRYGRAAERERAECAEAARALLSGWAERRRTLMQVVTMHSAAECPTAHHRLLCRLALYIASPSENTRRAYEACGGPASEVPPSPAGLPRLAAELYPQRQVYFEEELAMADDSPESCDAAEHPLSTR